MNTFSGSKNFWRHADTAEYTTTIIGAVKGNNCLGGSEESPHCDYCTYTYSTYYK